MDSSNLIRKRFLDYFKKHNHKVSDSSSLIPNNDPTLLFTNAGMVQFKNIFTGAEKINSKRIVTSQKCVRAGGKHNDLDNVGYTPRHHTFFEMLGNFSFGDYFKEEAIYYAWDLLKNGFDINLDKLIVTVFSEDSESFDIWKKISNFHDKRIIKVKSNDNFWSMGNIGPCGPCTEIFYDYGKNLNGSITNNGIVGDRYVEIWNLVFMEFNQIDKNKREDLPEKCVDTGMGLERITSVLQGTQDNYKTDLFTDLIKQIMILSKSKNKNEDNNISYRVIADHVRSSVHLVADGILPSNEGRGYVLRRIMRRGMRHAHMIGCRDPIFYKLAPIIINQMKKVYPELSRAEKLIIETLKNEEVKFKETLERGLVILNNSINKIKNKLFPGDIAFTLYDTYGFPLDLTEDILRSKNISVDLKIFNKKMNQQKEKARTSWKGSGDQVTNKVWFKILEKFGPTEFTGYDNLQSQGKILEIIKNENVVKNVGVGEEAIIVTNQTPFYGESGGQEGDKGILWMGKNKFLVSDTKKILKIHLHYGKIENGKLSANQTINMKVDEERRRNLTIYHSATHLLHSSLRTVLGTHVTQKGSLVAADRLRFDFSHPGNITPDEIKSIEKIANKIINQKDDVITTVLSYKKAIELGAMALFGEKYDEEVRVVYMGKGTSVDHFSIELCGGTHVKNTGEIKEFKIVKQSSVASGVKRIEALRGQDLLAHMSKEKEMFVKEEKEREDKKIKGLNEYKKNINSLNNAKKNIIKEGLENSINYYFRTVIDFPPNNLPDLVDEKKGQMKSGVIVYLSEYEKKISIVVGVTKDLISKVNAVDIVKLASESLGGKGGGGRPDFARAGGGKDIKKISPTYDLMIDFLKKL